MSTTNSFFKEKDEIVNIINNLCNFNDYVNNYIHFDNKFKYIELILCKYQEQPLLLNSSLPELIAPLSSTIINIVSLSINSDNLFNSSSNDFIQLNSICKIFQLICRVRGFKHVMKQLPHEVEHLELCLSLLNNRKELLTHDNWETKYTLLLWLRMLCLIPFDICSMDSTITSNTKTSDNFIDNINYNSNLVSNIVSICIDSLKDTGPTREAAAVCLSTLLTRPDMEINILGKYLQSIQIIIQSWLKLGSQAGLELSKKSFEILGNFQCLSQIFKSGHRLKLLPYTSDLLDLIIQLSNLSNQTLMRKLITKTIQRIGLTYLPPRVTKWRYQRGQRSLLVNLQDNNKSNTVIHNQISNDLEEEEEDIDVPDQLNDIIEYLLTALADKDTVVRWSAAKGIGRLTTRLTQSLADDVVGALISNLSTCDMESDNVWHGGCLAIAELARRGVLLPNRLEEVIPLVIQAMQYDILRGYHSVGAHVRDAACYVCWAFARAYSPAVMKLYTNIDDNPTNLHINNSLTFSMLSTTLYDREINCRRAASAAFQEHVGRQGHENFNHGLEIINIADYHILGNRKSTYLTISPIVASLSNSLFTYLWDHLIINKIKHWDENIRELSSMTLGRLIDKCIDNHNDSNNNISKIKSTINDILIPNSYSKSDSFLRHGSILSISEILLSFAKKSISIDDHILYKISIIPSEINRLRLYRGKGSEFLRIGVCKLIETIANCHIPILVITDTTNNTISSSSNSTSRFPNDNVALTGKKLFINLLETLIENMKQPFDSIQLSAQSALRQFLYTYIYNKSSSIYNNYSSKEKLKLYDMLTTKFSNSLVNDNNVAVTRGSALGLAILPLNLLNQLNANEFNNNIINNIIDITKLDRLIGGEIDPETRRNAIESSIEIIEKLLHYNKFYSLYRIIWNICLQGCTDYSTDKRGDTGSWSRIASIHGLERLLLLHHRYIDIHRYNNTNDIVLTSFGYGIRSGASNDICYIKYSDRSLYNYLYPNNDHTLVFSHLSGIIPISDLLDNQLDYLVDVIDSDVQLIEQIFNECLKQLAEKLDSVREVAGKTINRLISNQLFNNNSDVLIFRDCINKSIIRLANNQKISSNKLLDLQLDDEQVDDDTAEDTIVDSILDWSKPAHVFPFLSDIMISLPKYIPSILLGLISSLGGLSDTIAKEAFNAILSYYKTNNSSIDIFINTLFNYFSIYISNKLTKLDRYINPLVKTLELFLKHDIITITNYYNNLLDIENIIINELRICTNVKRIRLYTDIIYIYLSYYGLIRCYALEILINLLGHKYPKIRSYVAEILYLQFISDSNAIGKSSNEVKELIVADPLTNQTTRCGFACNAELLDTVTNILVTIQWDNNTDEAREQRAKICELLSIDLTYVRGVKSNNTSNNSKRGNEQVVDELDSYSSLVRDVGY